MRSDMAKVIVERPRFFGTAGYPGKGGHKQLAKVPLDERPAREGGRGRVYGHGQKVLNEHLGPLRRFLRRRCGEPWDEVYAEICERIRLDSAVQSHVRDHVDQYVCTHTRLIDSEVCDSKGLPFQEEWYVDPRDGTLQYRGCPRWRRPPRPQRDDVVDDTWSRQYHRIRGIWYEVTLDSLPSALGALGVYDCVLQRRVGFGRSDSKLVALYGRRMYAARKRQLNKREIRRLGLKRRLPANSSLCQE